MNTAFFIIVLLLYLFSIFKDMTTPYYSNPHDLYDVAPWFKARVVFGTFVVLSFFLMLATFYIIGPGAESCNPKIISIAKWLLYFGK